VKRILICLISFCGVLSSFRVQADVDEMLEVMSKELEQRSFKFSKAAKKSETYAIKYGVAEDGSLMHVGIWSDCVIGTVVGNAPNIGLQIIMLTNGSIFDQSANYTKKKDYFVNKYSWGKVTSWDSKQVIEWK